MGHVGQTGVRNLDSTLEAKTAQLEDFVVVVGDDGRSSERELGEQQSRETQLSDSLRHRMSPPRL